MRSTFIVLAAGAALLAAAPCRAQGGSPTMWCAATVSGQPGATRPATYYSSLFPLSDAGPPPDAAFKAYVASKYAAPGKGEVDASCKSQWRQADAARIRAVYEGADARLSTVTEIAWRP